MIKIDCCKFPVCQLHWSFDSLSMILCMCVVAFSLGTCLESNVSSGHLLWFRTFMLVNLKRQLL